MTKNAMYTKRIIAVAVALVLLLGTLFTGVVSSQASSFTDGLTHVATSSLNQSKYLTYSTITDITGGGILYRTNTQNGALSPYAHGGTAAESTGAFPGNGVRLQFNNYVTSSEGTYPTFENYQKFMVVLAQRTGSNAGNYYRMGNGVGAVLFDTKNGKLQFIKGTADGGINAYDVLSTIATDDALLYANFTGKAFTLDFAAAANGGIDVAVTVGENYIYGNIPASVFAQLPDGKRPINSSSNNTWIVVSQACVSNASTNAHSTMSLEYYGFKKGITVQPVVPDYAKGLTSVATAAKNSYSNTVSYRTVTDIEKGGVTLSYTNYSGYMPYGFNENIGATIGVFPGTYGVQFQFAGYKNNNTATGNKGNGIIALALSTQQANDKNKLKTGVPFLALDTNAGTLKLMHGNSEGMTEHIEDQVIISENDLLKKANIENVPFTITIAPYDSTNWLAAVDVNGTAVAGLITKALVQAQTYCPSTTQGVFYTSVGGIDNDANANNKWQINFYGYKKLDASYVAPSVTPVTPPEGAGGLAQNVTNKATVALNGMTTNAASISVTDIAGGGVKVNYLNSGSYYPYVHNVNIGTFFANNYRLQFNGYESTETNTAVFGYRQFGIGLSRTSTATDNCRKFFKQCSGLRFDTVTGKVDLVEGQNSTNSVRVISNVITNNALKYNNFAGKAFTVDFINNDASVVKVVITIDNGEGNEPTVLEGSFTRAVYNSLTYPLNTTNGYFTVSGMEHAQGSNKWSIEYYGWSLLENPPTGLADGLTAVALKEKEYSPWNNNTRIVTNLNGGGVSIRWTGGFSGYAPYRWSENLAPFVGEGMTFQFDNYQIDPTTATTAQGYGKILFCMSSTMSNDCTKIKKDVPFLEIDTVNGSVKLRHCLDVSFGTVSGFADDETIIANSEIIKYSKIQGKPFTLSIKPKNDGNYLIEIDVAGQIASGTMTAAKFNAITNKPNALTTYVSVGGYENNSANNKWSIDFYGYKKIVIPAPTIDVSQLTETATTATDLYPRPALKEVKDLENGGVSVNFKGSNGGYVPYSYTVNLGNFPGEDGFKLQFSNYINIANKTDANKDFYGKIAIVLSNTQANDSTKTKKGVAFLLIDTEEGELSLRYCNNGNWGNVEQGTSEIGFTTVETLKKDDLLKYENFTRKAFSLTFKKSATSEGNVDIIIEVGGDGNTVKGETVTALLDMKKFNSITYHAGSATFVSVGGFDNDNKVSNPFYFEFYGYQNFSVKRKDVIVTTNDVAAVNSAIAALPATASEAAAEAILLAKAQYDSLDATAQGQVSGADKLATLVAELNTLRNASKIKPVSTYLAREADASLGFPEFGNQHARTLFSKATDNGFAMEWRGGGAVSGHETIMSQSIYGAYKLDGLRLFLDNYTFADKASDFWVQFTSGDYDDFWNVSAEHTDKTIAIRLGLQKGRLELYGAGNKSTWVAGDTALLHRDNLKDKDFIIEWKKQANGSYNCYITIGEQVVAFNLSKEDMAAMPVFDENEIRVIIGNGDAKAVFSMEATGIYSQINAASQAVIDKINTLPATVKNAADVTAVQNVVAAYNALSVAQKEQVYNVDALTVARAAVRKYEGVDEKGRDKNGYYIPNYLTDVYGDASKDQVYVRGQESPLGGIRYEWGGEGYGRKNCFKDHYVIDSISVRYDNWQYANDGALIVGFENSTQECKVFDRKQFDTRNGIWLLIGRDNTIYSTYANRDVTGVFPLFEANELLSGTNLMRKEFFVSWNVLYNEDGSMNLQVVFTVDGKDFKYTYDKKYMDALDLMDIEDIQVVTHCIAGNSTKGESIRTGLLTSALIDITGIKFEEFSTLQKNAIQEVIDAINALPEKASYDIEESVYDIWKMYYELSFTEMRLAVTNHDKLIKLYSELFDMRLADGTMYLVQEEEDDYLDGEDDYDWDDGENDYDDEDNAESEEESESTKKPIKVKRPKQNTNEFPWIIVIIGGIVLLAAAAIIIILVTRKNKEDK